MALVLWASAAFQLGNNLTGEKPISISPPGAVGWRDAAEAVWDGDRGAMLLYTKEGGPPDPDRRWISQKVRYSICSFDLSGGDLKLGPEIPVGVGRRPNWYGSSLRRIVFSPVHPNRAYCLVYELALDAGSVSRFALCTVALDAGGQNKIVHELDLLGYLESDTVSHPQMYLFGRRIYVRTISGTLAIDLRDGDSTEVSEVIALTTGFRIGRGGPGDRGFSIESLELLPAEGLSPRERLEVSLNLTSLGYPFAFEDDMLVIATAEHLTTYRLTELDQSTACFQKIARLHATPLELIVLNWPQRMILRDGLAYVLAGGLYVYDVRDPEQPKRAGHYASPSESLLAISLLPDGRVLAAGQKIHILDPPRDRLEKE